MNRGEIKTLAREITDLDTTDVSDTLLEMYVKDGFERIVSIERRWPSYETSSTLVTVAGTQSYLVSGVASGVFREITSLYDQSNGYRLTYIGHDEAEGSYYGANVTGTPRYYSQWASSIWMWPTPTEAITYTARGYRLPLETWQASDVVEIDSDERLHQSLVYFAVMKMFEYQEDAEMAQVYDRQYTEAAKLARDDIMRIPANVPMILSQGRRY